jgi:hypothetical protein
MSCNWLNVILIIIGAIDHFAIRRWMKTLITRLTDGVYICLARKFTIAIRSAAIPVMATSEL